MTTAAVPPLFDFSEVIINNKNNKMLNYNNNILSAPHTMSVPCTGANLPISSPTGSLLDRKAVGTPSISGVYQRRHSVTLPSSKLNQNQFLSNSKVDPALLGSGMGSAGGSNKENRLRDRSFSETGERLLQKCAGSGGPGGSQVNSSRYKTELCRPFEENGTCKYGDKCQFAHGIHELRSLSRHPKYKTELCRTFHTIGFCPYGPRCHFIHNAEERRGPPPTPSPLSASNKLERPRLQHSYSFAGFPSSGGLRDSPTSVTPPPMFSPDELPEWPSSNPFTYSSQELANLFGPGLGGGPSSGPDPVAQAPPSPSATPYYFRPMSESPHLFESQSSQPDSLSDQEGYQSSSGGSLSGSESPVLDTTRRLPIFSRLSISDD
ncbi:mRNA decay activator protein ZFP36L1a [Electrophorus electricus]|uniref:mRNA decay activator protein ZFP36 n=1 Tax=Electrophorus electricus TaxID=8005 RepID=A0AAY5ENH4_ELEEL|nr:mRNA decay activator protein ZFP36L1a [Electrophorus electricus]